MQSLRDDKRGFIDMGQPLMIVGSIVGVLVGVILIAAFSGPVFDATGDLVDNFTNATTGDETTDSILPVFGTVVALSIVLGLVGLVLYVSRFEK